MVNESISFQNEVLSKDNLNKILCISIAKVMHEDAKLFATGCSERAIVHWLATYFLEIAQNELDVPHPDVFFDHQNGYVVDVEYNRIGSDGESKHLYDMASRCKHCTVSEKCIKQPAGKTNDAIMIDMVFHSRSSNKRHEVNPYKDNLLCVEVKTSSSTQIERECDEERIKILVDRQNIVQEDIKALKEPKYLLGATVYFETESKAKIKIFDGNNTPQESVVYKSDYKG